MKKKNFILEALIALILICIIANPTKYSAVSLNAIIVWATLLLPVLFPFIFFTKLMSDFNIIKWLSLASGKLTKPLYNTSGKSGYIFTMSILSGYPLGAKLTADAYLCGEINRGEAIRTLAYSSNSGPMFIIGTVGCGMLLSNSAGLVMLISHILGALLNGLLYRKYALNDKTYCYAKSVKKTEENITDKVLSSINSILIIGAYVCLFFIISQIAIDLNIFKPFEILFSIFHLPADVTKALLSGILEITKGTQEISKITSLSLQLKTILSCLIISFGGIATFMQGYTFLSPIKIPAKIILLQKFTHALISTFFCVILTLIFL